MIYHHLLANQSRLLVRSFARRRHWAVLLFLSLLILYVAFALLSLGFLWREMVSMVRPGIDSVAFLNRHLVTVFLALFTLRFFVQRTPRLRIRPYMHLPVSRRGLVYFFQAYSLGTVHNLFPFLFFLPLWLRHLHGSYPPAAAWGWLGGVVLLLLISHFLNTLLRTLLNKGREGFFGVLGVLILLIMHDLLLGPGIVDSTSAFIFDTLVTSRPIILLLLLGLLGVVFQSSSLLLWQSLLEEEDQRRRLILWQASFKAPEWRLYNLILLELKLMWRSERPKLYFLFSVVFGMLYVAVPLLNVELVGHPFVQAFIVLFASGIFAFNYGQLMFAWESSYFDGLLARGLSLRRMVLAKMVLLQGSCAVFFILSLPIFLVLMPDFVSLHVAFLLYNAGISTLLILALALRNRSRVQLADVGFFDFEGFSLLHWLWYIPTVVPPALLLYYFEGMPYAALVTIGGAGMLSLLFTPLWVSLFTRLLHQQRYEMAAAFRL